MSVGSRLGGSPPFLATFVVDALRLYGDDLLDRSLEERAARFESVAPTVVATLVAAKLVKSRALR